MYVYTHIHVHNRVYTGCDRQPVLIIKDIYLLNWFISPSEYFGPIRKLQRANYLFN